jgi:hypothetical protein
MAIAIVNSFQNVNGDLFVKVEAAIRHAIFTVLVIGTKMRYFFSNPVVRYNPILTETSEPKT